MTIFTTRRHALIAGLAATATMTALPLWAQDDTAKTDAPAATTDRTVQEMAMGSEDAPITVVEYASLTCPHCARFSTDVFPKIKANYVEMGKVRFIVHDVYFDRYGLWAAMIARCGGQEKYFGITDRMFAKQGDWARKQDPREAVDAMMAIGRQAGLTDEEMQACTQDQAWAEKLVAEFQKNAEADKVEGTPTFIINGEKYSNMPYDEFSKTLDEILAKS